MPTNVYGLKDNFDLMNSHVMPAMIRKFHEAKQKMAKGKGQETVQGSRFKVQAEISNIEHRTLNKLTDVILWGTGSPFREFLFVDDLADACVFLMERYDYREIGELINIGTGKDITIGDLALIIRDIVGFKGEIVWDSTKPDGTPKKLLDISRIKALGWGPKTSLEEGISKTYEWYLKTMISNE
jgi:GDP-L-fucose synthase